MNVGLSDAALADLDPLRSFLWDIDRNAASGAVETMLSAAYSLSEWAERGVRLRGFEERRLTVPFGRGAYLLDYRVDQLDGVVIILRVRHSREAR